MTSTANFTGRSSSKTPRAASRSPRKAPPLADLYPFGIVATVRCNGLTLCDYGGKIQLGTTPGDGGAGCIPREELARYIRTEPPGGETPSAQLLRSTPSRPGTSTHASVSTTCVSPTPGKPGATPTRRRAAPSPPSARSSTPGAEPSPCGPPRPASTQREPLPQGTGSLYGIIDYFAGKYTLRVTNREAEFSSTAAHSAATRRTAGRPARTTRTTRAGVTAATPPTAYP